MEAVDEATDADEAARRWLRTMRRIDKVTIHVRNGRTAAVLSGVGHRLPVTRPISLLAAAGLCRRGVPVTIEEEAR